MATNPGKGRARLGAVRGQLAAIVDPVALLEGLVAFAPFALQIFDATGRSVLVNDAFRALFGGDPPAEYNVLRDEVAARTGVMDQVRRAFAGETVRLPALWYDPREIAHARLTTSRRVAIEPTFFPLFGHAETVAHVGIIFKDMTAELQAREQAETERRRLAQSERRLRTLAEASEAFSSSLDYQTVLGKIASLAVPSVTEWCLVDLLESDGALRGIAVAHADPARVEDAWRRRRRVHYSWDALSGPPRVVRTRRSEVVADVGTLPSGEGEPAGLLRALGIRSYVCVPLQARDAVIGAITFGTSEGAHARGPEDLELIEELARRAGLAIDNARLYREARDANRLKDEFLATVSHELRTPLNAILGWARIVRAKHADPAVVERGLITIERNAHVQTQLVEDILDVSRIITGKLRLELHPLELAPIVSAALDVLRPTAEAKGVRLELSLDPFAGPIIGDASRLQQIVWNLVSNAIKFTPKGGRIDVEVTAAGGEVELRVRDTGQGIPVAFLPHIFEAFRQADSSSTRTHAGLGLGLAIVRHLVELHGGAVRAESGGEGRGATFTVVLPVRRAAEERDGPLPAPDVPAPAAPLRGLRVLTVDDEPDARELLAAVLGEAGASVVVAGSVAEAMQHVAQGPPDILVSDIGMPHEDGYALIARLRALPAELGGRTPAIALTAYARPEDRRRALSAGFSMHLAKPIDPDRLVTAVARLAPHAH